MSRQYLKNWSENPRFAVVSCEIQEKINRIDNFNQFSPFWFWENQRFSLNIGSKRRSKIPQLSKHKTVIINFNCDSQFSDFQSTFQQQRDHKMIKQNIVLHCILYEIEHVKCAIKLCATKLSDTFTERIKKKTPSKKHEKPPTLRAHSMLSMLNRRCRDPST